MSSPCCSTILSAFCKLERKGERDGAAFIFITTQLLRRPFSPEKELKRKHYTAWAKFIHLRATVLLSSLPLSLPVCVWLAGCASPLLSSPLACFGVAQTHTNTKVVEHQCQQMPAPHSRGTGSHSNKNNNNNKKLGTTYKKKRREEEEEEEGTLSVCLVAPLLPFTLV